MAELSEIDFAAAEAAGAVLDASEPRAIEARYDSATAMIVVALRNGCSFSFPARLGQGLGSATEIELAAVEIDGGGYGLHWEALDVDLAVPSLLMGRFGSDAHMRALLRAA